VRPPLGLGHMAFPPLHAQSRLLVSRIAAILTGVNRPLARFVLW